MMHSVIIQFSSVQRVVAWRDSVQRLNRLSTWLETLLLSVTYWRTLEFPNFTIGERYFRSTSIIGFCDILWRMLTEFRIVIWLTWLYGLQFLTWTYLYQMFTMWNTTQRRQRSQRAYSSNCIGQSSSLTIVWKFRRWRYIYCLGYILEQRWYLYAAIYIYIVDARF